MSVVASILALLALVVAAAHDVAFRTIPNWISCLLVVPACFVHLRDGDFLHALEVGVLLFIGSAFLWQRGWMGGGDVKFMAAAGFLLPPSEAFAFVFLISLLGGVLALVYLCLPILVARPVGSQHGGPLVARILRTERWRISRRAPLPYAVAIAGAAFILIV